MIVNSRLQHNNIISCTCARNTQASYIVCDVYNSYVYNIVRFFCLLTTAKMESTEQLTELLE